MSLRPLWKGSNPAEIKDWNPLSDDLLEFLDERKAGRIIGTGHSIGASVTLRAALSQPDRFQALVLIEPVIFPLYFMLGMESGTNFRPGSPSASQKSKVR